MGKINVLDQSVANLIAAGEVVERPASVVKELLENSIDAGAKTVTVEIKNGGMRYIRVTDDGSGIAPEDVRTAFLPHATSKIKTSADLDSIYTLGFRGEALASIAAVSRVEIYTKTAKNALGRLLVIEGGKVLEESDTGCADGTTVIVRNLFFNTPARMKFLKKDATETSHVADVVQKAMLGNPNVAIKFLGGAKPLSSPGDGKLQNAIYTVYGKACYDHILPVDDAGERICVTGFAGDMSLARGNRACQVFFLNGRCIVSKSLSAALAEAYKHMLMVGKFPFAVLNIRINAAFVDVNVHPTKQEVRFSDERAVFDAVYWAVKNALSQKKQVPEIKVNPSAFDAPDPKQVTQQEINFLKDSFVKDRTHYEKGSADILPGVPITKEALHSHPAPQSFLDDAKHVPAEVSSPLAPAHPEPQKAKEQPHATQNRPEGAPWQPGLDFTIAGQIFDTYIIVQKGEEMLIIDQHAAHERLYFEQFLAAFYANDMQSQALLVPFTLHVTPLEFDTICQNFDFFSSLGFLVEAFGNSDIILRSVPAALIESNLKDVVTELIAVLGRGGDSITDTQRSALYTMACKRALKGNRKLSVPEMERLVSDLSTLGSINTCPHGRPIEIKMTKTDLEKQFKRIVG